MSRKVHYSKACISSLQCLGGSLATTDWSLIVNSVPQMLHRKSCKVSRTSSGSISGGVLANDEIELLRNLNTKYPINSAIKYSINRF